MSAKLVYKSHKTVKNDTAVSQALLCEFKLLNLIILTFKYVFAPMGNRNIHILDGTTVENKGKLILT